MKMKNKLSIVISLLAVFYLIACQKDFIVKDIKDKSLTVLAPANNTVTTSNQISFWWEELDGAEKYNIQIVKPSFTNIIKLVADTNVKGTRFNMTLTPGVYQWRIKGVNAGGSTPYQIYSFTIDSTSNLSGQLVSNVTPTNSTITGNKRVAFSWNSLNAALQYQIQILNSSSGIVKDTTTTLTTYTYSLPNVSASYSYKVRALNSTSVSQYNTPFTFTIDVTPPAAPTLSIPINASLVTATNSLTWVRSGTDVVFDSVFVANDSLFTSIVSTTKTFSQTIVINTLQNAPTVTNVFYWWRVRSVDAAGNRSGFSNQAKFKLIP
jgi:hypothetical protein